MKKRMFLAAVAAMLVSVLAVPASADTFGVGAFTGTAVVGVNPGNIAKNACTDPSGQGLGLPNLTTKRGGWRIRTNTILGAVADPTGQSGMFTSGLLDACGRLGPVGVVGASCGLSSGSNGVGVLVVNVASGPDALNLFNLGWLTSAGGTIRVTGNYEEQTGGAKNNKVGFVTALVQAQGGAACLTKPPGAQQFNVMGAIALSQ